MTFIALAIVQLLFLRNLTSSTTMKPMSTSELMPPKGSPAANPMVNFSLGPRPCLFGAPVSVTAMLVTVTALEGRIGSDCV